MNRATGLYSCGTVGLLVSCLLSVIGTDELRLSLQSGSKPFELSAATLATAGPTGHAYICRNQFAYCWNGSLGQCRDPHGPLAQVWVPLAPATRRPPAGRDVCAILIIAGPGTWENVHKKLASGQITGIIKTRGGVPDPAEMEHRNPGLRSADCWEIWEGKTPWPLPAAGGAVFGSVVLFSVGLLLVDSARRQRSGVNQGAAATVAFMSPLIYAMDALTQVFGTLRLGKRWIITLLSSTAVGFLALGGWLVCRGEWLSLAGSIGWAFTGMMCVNLGVGLLTLAVAAAFRKEVRQQASIALLGITIAARQIGPYIAGVGAGLMLVTLAKWQAGGPLPTWMCYGVGVGVILLMVGLYLCFFGRARERCLETRTGTTGVAATANR